MKLQHRLVFVLVLVLVLCGGQIAGAKPRPSQCDPNVEKNYNYAGNDLVINGSSTGVQAKSIADCCQICQSLADAKPKGCSFYTYRHSLSMCHPKFSNAGRTSSSGATSGSRTPPPPPPPPPPPYKGDQPNILFLIDESTDGRVYNPDPDNTSVRRYATTILALAQMKSWCSVVCCRFFFENKYIYI